MTLREHRLHALRVARIRYQIARLSLHKPDGRQAYLQARFNLLRLLYSPN